MNLLGYQRNHNHNPHQLYVRKYMALEGEAMAMSSEVDEN